MTSVTKLANTWFTVLALSALAVDAQISTAEHSKPNVVVLLSDDLGWKDIGCYDGPVKTPSLDRLASQGMRFTDFYSGAAVCSPSRAVLLTGRTNVRASIYSWINDHDQRSHLPTAEVTLAEVLKRGGYATAHFGKWHLGLPSAKFPKTSQRPAIMDSIIGSRRAIMHNQVTTTHRTSFVTASPLVK